MMTHFAPRVPAAVAEDLRHFTRKWTDLNQNPSFRAERHCALLFGRKPKPNNTVIGDEFEAVVYDALVEYGIDPLRVQWHVDMTGHDNKCAEIDILIEPANGGMRYGLFCKTSVRERWKQMDRDGILVREYSRGSVRTIGIVYQEKPGDTTESIDRHMVSLLKKSRGMDQYVSIRQVAPFNDLVAKIKAQ